ncbi:MAG: transposase [Solirubrobacterales bacterium]|nr:transposase [Solirubrobacterales bacterium]
MFANLFTRPTWARVLLLIAGAILVPGRRTVAAVLRILGLDQDGDFATYHAVLNRARWSSRAVAGRLLRLLVASFVPADAAILIGLDDTIERRWGPRIRARGIYRDPVRSSKAHLVKTSGLRWLSAMLMVRVPWAGRVLALPFLTVLAPSKRYYADQPRSPKTLLDCARQAIFQIRRWLPGRRIVLVADGAFAALDFLAAVRRHLCLVTRLRLDANLFDPAPPRPPGKRGRKAVRGKKQPKLARRLLDPATIWEQHTVALWYGRANRVVEIASGTAVWYHGGLPPVPIRWLLVRDPSGELEPQAFLATDLDAAPADILQWFVHRWQVEVTFEETRAHLGIETQRQWSDLAILRTTPALLGLFSLIVLWANDIAATQPLRPRTAAWYPKALPTFSDAIAAVRRQIWAHHSSFMSPKSDELVKIPAELWHRMATALSHAA